MTVVGVSGPIIQDPQQTTQNPVLFVPYRQEAPDGFAIAIRTNVDPAGLTTAVRGAVRAVDADLPLFAVRTFAADNYRSQWPYRVFGTVFGIFAIVALLMASIGVYAVIAQATSRRTREIGVRMALGASSGRILTLVLARGAWQVGLGLGLGLAAAVGVTRVMVTLLYHVSPLDPVVFTTVGVVLAGVGLIACWLPARRAALLNPVQALRDE